MTSHQLLDADIIGIEKMGEGENSTAFFVHMKNGCKYVFLHCKATETWQRLHRLSTSKTYELLRDHMLPVALPRYLEITQKDPPCIVYPMIPGTPLERAMETMQEPELHEVLRRLGTTVRRMHDFPNDQIGGLQIRTLDFDHYLSRDFLDKHVQGYIDGDLFQVLHDDSSRLLDECTSLRRTATVVHADLGLDHVIYDRATNTLGIIDVEHMQVNDPDLDIYKLLRSLNPDARSAFLETYGHPDQQALERKMQFLGLRRALIMLERWDIDSGKTALDQAFRGLQQHDPNR